MKTSLHKHVLLATMIGTLLAGGIVQPASARQPAGAQQDQRHEDHQSNTKKKADKKKAENQKKAQAAKHADGSHAAASKARETAQRNDRAHQQQRVAESQKRAAQLRQHQVQDARKAQAHQRDDHQRISERDHRDRIDQQRSWALASTKYQQHTRELEQQRARLLQQQKRNAQYRYQQAYYQRVNAQQARLIQQRYDYNVNPYFTSPNTYRYSYGGKNYTTNKYGADLLRQAVNYGYQEGLRAGYADRSDRSRSDYQNTYAYQDASYGYDNYYVNREEYNYYFRQGFQRGYNDGFGSQSRYGTYSSNYFNNNNESASILQTVLATILNLQQMNP